MSAYGSLIFALLAPAASAFVVPLFHPERTDKPKLEDPFMIEPQGRGTVGLLTSCSLTFLLCIWTTIHPNILARSDSLRESDTSPRSDTIPKPKGGGQFKFKCIWMVIAILFPEAVMMCALGERRRAKEVFLAWKAKFTSSKKVGLAEGYFVEMGGFTARDSDGKLFILTTDGFIKYVKSGQITENMIDVPTISDKGNASGFTKLITFLQGTWFLFRCVSRWYQGFPVTLLERHVAIQVLFTLLACIFWWYKPLDVICPIHLTFAQPPPATDEVPSVTDGIPPVTEKTPPVTEKTPPVTDEARGSTPEERNAYVENLNFIYEGCRSGVPSLVTKALFDAVRYACNGRKSNMLQIFLFLFCNGLWHLFSWDAHFPTPVEEILWGVSCIMMCALAFIHNGLGMLEGAQRLLLSGLWEGQFVTGNPLRGYIRLFMQLTKEAHFPMWKNFLMVLMWVLAVGYICAVLFILLESFISVRSLIEGSYGTAKSDLSKYFVSFW